MKLGDVVSVRFNDFISKESYSGSYEVTKINFHTFWIRLNEHAIIKRHKEKHLIK
jgi:hypothetical protein